MINDTSLSTEGEADIIDNKMGKNRRQVENLLSIGKEDNTDGETGRKTRQVENLPYDAVFEVGNDSNASSFKTNSTHASPNTGERKEIPGHAKSLRYEIGTLKNIKYNKSIESSELSMSDDGNDSSVSEQPDQKEAHGSNRFTNLNVSANINEIFQYIDRYKPSDIDSELELKCFIPSYIPAIGNIDPILNIPRPDGVTDGLGKKVLDEPGSIQSDTAVLQLQLRSLSKKHHDDMVVRSIDNTSGYGDEIDRWIASVSDLHQTPILPNNVYFMQSMPALELLMQTWPIDFQEALESIDIKIPSPKLNLNVKEFAKVLCLLLDIPVRAGSLLDSLHLVMNLFIAFQNNGHFTPSI